MSIVPEEWVRLLRREYLQEFIPAGGAAVKIAGVPPCAARVVLTAVGAAAEEHRCFVGRVDSASTRVHLIDQLFFAVARQVEWDTLTDRFLRELLQANGIECEGLPLSDMGALAEANGRSRTGLLSEINRLVENAVLGDAGLSSEFGTALAMLCRGRYNPQNVNPTDADLVKQWLRGEKCHLTGLKRLQIYQRIGRHNARPLLASLAGWLHQVGYAGLALVMDFSAVGAGRRAEDSLRYTRNTLLDSYEVLRQFIDETDEVEHLLVVVVAGPGLVDDPKRSVDNYTALKMRIVDEVRDQNRPNPLNAMVRLAAEGEGGLECSTRW